jgi:hypothetical protein
VILCLVPQVLVGLAAVPAMSMARQGALSSPAGRARSCAGTDLEAGQPVGRAYGSQRRVEANGLAIALLLAAGMMWVTTVAAWAVLGAWVHQVEHDHRESMAGL